MLKVKTKYYFPRVFQKHSQIAEILFINEVKRVIKLSPAIGTTTTIIVDHIRNE